MSDYEPRTCCRSDEASYHAADCTWVAEWIAREQKAGRLGPIHPSLLTTKPAPATTEETP